MSGALDTTYADTAQMAEWFARAAAGAYLTYARGVSISSAHAAVRLVREWAATREAVTVQKRVGPEFHYIVQRCRPAERTAQDQTGRRVSVDDAWRETAQGRIFLALVRAANMGLPCPSNQDLADCAGLRDGDAARYQVRLLERAGRVLVEHSGAGRSVRRVKINETGRWTASVKEGGK